MASTRLPLSWIIGATAVAVAAAAVTVLVIGRDSDDDKAADQSAEGGYELTPTGDLPDSVGDIVLTSLRSEPDARLADQLGQRPVVVNFFALWCRPCLQELPAYERVHQDLGDQVTFVGLAEDRTAADALEMVERTGVSFPTFLDQDGAALTYFESTGMPTTVLIGADGNVVDIEMGELSEDELRDKLREHFSIS